MFQHLGDRITINGLTLPLEFFQQLEPAYELPEGAIGRNYIPSTEHVITYAVGMMGADPTWAEGDTYLGKFDEYQDAYANYIAPSQPSADLIRFPRWEQLKNSLRSSDLFAKAYTASSDAPGAWSLLLSSLDSNSPADSAGRWADFEFAISQLRLAMGGDDFTAEQVERFNEILTECQFETLIS